MIRPTWSKQMSPRRKFSQKYEGRARWGTKAKEEQFITHQTSNLLTFKRYHNNKHKILNKNKA